MRKDVMDEVISELVTLMIMNVREVLKSLTVIGFSVISLIG